MPVTSRMVPASTMLSRDLDLVGNQTLDQLIDELDKANIHRLPLFKQGIAKFVVHRSMMEQFLLKCLRAKPPLANERFIERHSAQANVRSIRHDRKTRNRSGSSSKTGVDRKLSRCLCYGKRRPERARAWLSHKHRFGCDTTAGLNALVYVGRCGAIASKPTSGQQSALISSLALNNGPVRSFEQERPSQSTFDPFAKKGCLSICAFSHLPL